MHRKAKMLFLGGKMAAGKSTLSRKLAERENAVPLAQDEFLEQLFPGEIVDIPGFPKYSSRLKDALGPHICSLLSTGVSVVLDDLAESRPCRIGNLCHLDGRVDHVASLVAKGVRI
jgi:predicted kinase